MLWCYRGGDPPSVSSVRAAALIPSLDSEATVGDVVRGMLDVLGHVIVVDDGSQDRTADAAREAGAHVVRHLKNRGKGAALATGLREAFDDGYTHVVALDADGQHLPEEIHKLLAVADQGADLVLGVRDHLFGEMSRLRRTSNSVSTGLISFAAKFQVSDVQTGFRYYSRPLLESVGLRETGFEAESAVFVRAARQGFEIMTTPIELGFSDGRLTSHFRPWDDGVRIARAVVKAMRERKPAH